MDADSHAVCRCNLNSIYMFRSISARRYQQSGAGEVHGAPSSGLYFPVQGASSLGSPVSSLWKGKQSRATCFLGQRWSSPSELSPALDASPKCRAASQLQFSGSALNCRPSFIPLASMDPDASVTTQARSSHSYPTKSTAVGPGPKIPAKQALSSETHQAPQLAAQH